MTRHRCRRDQLVSPLERRSIARSAIAHIGVREKGFHHGLLAVGRGWTRADKTTAERPDSEMVRWRADAGGRLDPFSNLLAEGSIPSGLTTHPYQI